MLFGFIVVDLAGAATAREIDTGVDVALERFHREIRGSEFLWKFLSAPNLIKRND